MTCEILIGSTPDDVCPGGRMVVNARRRGPEARPWPKPARLFLSDVARRRTGRVTPPSGRTGRERKPFSPLAHKPISSFHALGEAKLAPRQAEQVPQKARPKRNIPNRDSRRLPCSRLLSVRHRRPGRKSNKSSGASSTGSRTSIRVPRPPETNHQAVWPRSRMARRPRRSRRPRLALRGLPIELCGSGVRTKRGFGDPNSALTG